MERTLATSPLEEHKNGKRVWLKVEDMTNEIYKQHFNPTNFNTHVKILTSEQYVPTYLRDFKNDDGKKKDIVVYF